MRKRGTFHPAGGRPRLNRKIRLSCQSASGNKRTFSANTNRWSVVAEASNCRRGPAYGALQIELIVMRQARASGASESSW